MGIYYHWEKQNQKLGIMEKLKVFIGIPSRGRIHVSLLDFLMGLYKEQRYLVNVGVGLSKYSVDDARNIVVDKFLKTDADYLLFLDDDNPPIKNPLDLVELDKDIIACPVPVMRGEGLFTQTKIEWCVFQDDNKEWPKQTGLQEVDLVGLQCTLIARRVLEQVRTFQSKPPYSEDFNFCKEAREKGYKVFAHFSYPCHHHTEVAL